MAEKGDTVSGVPGRYATALFELAKEKGSVEATGAQLSTFQELLEESSDLSRLVRSPVFSADDQIAALEAIAARAGISGIALNFIKLVTRNRRLFAISDIIKAYRTLLAASKGEIQGEVISAEPLGEAHIAELKDTLRTAMGRDVQLSTRVDPSLLGGLVVKVGSRMVDNSLKTKLQNLKIAMKGIS